MERINDAAPFLLFVLLVVFTGLWLEREMPGWIVLLVLGLFLLSIAADLLYIVRGH